MTILFLLSTLLLSVGAMWPQTGYDAQNTNHLPYSASRGYLECGPTQDWVRNDLVSLQPIVGLSFTYFYISETSLRAVYIENNALYWEIPNKNFTQLLLSTDGLFLYVLSQSEVQMYNATSGALLQSIDLGTTITNNSYMTTFNNLLYISVGTVLFQVEPEKSRINWQLENRTNPIIDTDGNLYFAEENKIIVTDASANFMWKYLGNSSFVDLRIRYDGIIIASTQLDTLILNKSTPVLTLYNSTIHAVFSDNTMLGSNFDTLFRMKPTGDYIWNFTIGATIQSASIDGDKLVYAAGSILNQPVIYGIDATSGDLLWTFNLEDMLDSEELQTPVIIGDSSILQRVQNRIVRITPCNNRGMCKGNQCDCAANWYLSDCTQFCDNVQCAKASNYNGQCSASGICECSENYYPSFNCTVFCNATECNERSHCSENGCVCDNGYYGDNCDIACENGVFRENSCNCEENYYGNSCNQYCEIDQTCSSNGDCGENGECICYEGFKGASCGEKKIKTLLWILGPVLGGACICTGLIGAFVYKNKKKHKYQRLE